MWPRVVGVVREGGDELVVIGQSPSALPCLLWSAAFKRPDRWLRSGGIATGFPFGHGGFGGRAGRSPVTLEFHINGQTSRVRAKEPQHDAKSLSLFRLKSGWAGPFRRGIDITVVRPL